MADQMNRLIHSDKDSWVHLIYHDLSEYRKILKISPVAYIFRRPFFEGLIFGGAYLWRELGFQNQLA